MSILQFGFNPDANSDYLPHRVAENRVYYTGTHDNAPIMQWFAEASEPERRFAEQYPCAECRRGHQLGYDSRRHVFACRNLYRANAGCSRAFGGRESQHSGRCFRKLAVADAAARMQCRACGKAAGVYANVRKTARLRRDKL